MVTVSVSTIQMAPTVRDARISSKMLLGDQLWALRTTLADVGENEFSHSLSVLSLLSLMWGCREQRE
jgi:hypothetical protein